MANVKSFYGNKSSYSTKRTQHHVLIDAISQVDEDDPETADIIMIGPPTGGDDSDMEMDDDNSPPESGLPDEVAGEVEVQQYYAHDESEEEAMTMTLKR